MRPIDETLAGCRQILNWVVEQFPCAWCEATPEDPDHDEDCLVLLMHHDLQSNARDLEAVAVLRLMHDRVVGQSNHQEAAALRRALERLLNL